jgi:ribosomal protein L5
MSLTLCCCTALLDPSLYARVSILQDKDKNPMREIRVEKLILNICVGESGDRLTFASRVLEQLVRGSTPL